MSLYGGCQCANHLIFVFQWKHSLADLKKILSVSHFFFGESTWRSPNSGEQIHDPENKILGHKMFLCRHLPSGKYMESLRAVEITRGWFLL